MSDVPPLTALRQLVHYAGNLQVTAAVFLTLALLLAIVLATFTVAAVSLPAVASDSAREHDPKSADASTVPVTPRKRTAIPRSKATPYVTAMFLACLVIGAVTQVLAQYFGVLGLTVNATPSAADAIGAVHESDAIFFRADSWAISRGLSVYGTTAWASAIACAVVASSVFRTPRFTKVL